MTSIKDASLPIGIFDSGVGGLTVLKAIREALPNEDLVYLGDTARLPYGTKSPASIIRYATQATDKLREQPLKVLVIACNTATAVAHGALAESARARMPVLGVVGPGAWAAMARQNPVARISFSQPKRRFVLVPTIRRLRKRPIPMLTFASTPVSYWSLSRRRGGPTATSSERPSSATSMKRPATVMRRTRSFWAALTSRYCAMPLPTLPGRTSWSSIRRARRQASVAHVLEESGALNSAGGSLKLMATDGVTRFARVGGQFLGQPLAAEDVHLVDL